MPTVPTMNLSIQTYPLKLRYPQKCAICGRKLQAGRNAWAVKALGVPNFYCGLPHLRKGVRYWKEQRDIVVRNEQIVLEQQLELDLKGDQR